MRNEMNASLEKIEKGVKKMKAEHAIRQDEAPKTIRKVPNFREPQIPVEIIVGVDEEEQTFVVYRDFLIYYSPYFNSALASGNFKESKGVVELEHTQPEVFGLFVDWLYTQKVEDRSCKDKTIFGDVKARERKNEPTESQLVSLWILADYLQVPKLQNQAMDLLIYKNTNSSLPLTRLSESNCIASAYEETLPGSPLRKVFVDTFYWRLEQEDERERLLSHPDEFPKEFLLDLVYLHAGYNLWATDKSDQENPLEDPSDYHVKEDA